MKKLFRYILRPPIYRGLQIFRGSLKIRHFLKKHKEVKVIFGGHWEDISDWLILTERDADITRPLTAFPAATVDVIFSEHVIEHLPPEAVVRFFKETKRILKPDGIVRTVWPAFEKIVNFNPTTKHAPAYIQSTISDFSEFSEFLYELVPDEYLAYAPCIVANNLFLNHEHKFIWSTSFLVGLLKKIGFRDVQCHEVGRGKNPMYCLERRSRLRSGELYDPESGVVEACK